MGKGNKIKKPHHIESAISEYLKKKSSIADVDNSEDFLLSFKYLDRSQGSSLYDWENNKMLGLAIDTLGGYCNRPLKQQFDEKFTVYGSFPSNSNFKHPAHVPEDANWARIHINGLHIVAGHIVKNVFYVVFLDHDHTFYITKGADN